MQTVGWSRRKIIRGFWLFAIYFAFTSSHSLKAQSCLGLPTSRFSLTGVVSTSKAERTLGLIPEIQVGALAMRFSAERLFERGGLGSDGRYGAILVFGGRVLAASGIYVCPGIGGRWTRKPGSRASEVQVDISASLPSIVMRSGLRASPLVFLGLHREGVRFESVATAGEDYSQYNYSDVFGVIGTGLSVRAGELFSLRGAIAVPTRAVAQHAAFGIEVTVGIGRRNRK